MPKAHCLLSQQRNLHPLLGWGANEACSKDSSSSVQHEALMLCQMKCGEESKPNLKSSAEPLSRRHHREPRRKPVATSPDRIGLLRRWLAVFAQRLLTQFSFVFLKLLTFPRLVFSLTRNFLSLFLAQLECLTRLFPQSITLRRRFCGVLRGKQGMWLLAWGSKFSTACLEALMRSLVLRGAIEDATPTRQTQSQA